MAMVLALCAGCVTRIDWQARVGTYSYDQAIIELGPPGKSAKLTDGTVVADWMTQRSQVFIVNNGPYYPYGEVGPVGPAITSVNTPAYFLRLTFDPAGKLKSWKNYAR